MKTVKEFEIRRTEIMESAYRLFEQKGFKETKVIDITNDVNIAKGTFYHYFSSKEAVLEALVDEIVSEIVSHAKMVCENESLSIDQKLFYIIGDPSLIDDQSIDKEKHMNIKDNMHSSLDPKLHIDSMIALIKELSPILSCVISDGVKEGIFETKFPTEVVEVLLSSASILLDHDFAVWSEEEKVHKITIFLRLMETLLGVTEGGLSYLNDAFLIEKRNDDETK